MKFEQRSLETTVPCWQLSRPKKPLVQGLVASLGLRSRCLGFEVIPRLCGIADQNTELLETKTAQIVGTIGPLSHLKERVNGLEPSTITLAT